MMDWTKRFRDYGQMGNELFTISDCNLWHVQTKLVFLKKKIVFLFKTLLNVLIYF